MFPMKDLFRDGMEIGVTDRTRARGFWMARSVPVWYDY